MREILFKALIIMLMVIVFFLAYVGFVYLVLDGNIPKLTSLYSTISIILGLYVGVRLTDI